MKATTVKSFNNGFVAQIVNSINSAEEKLKTNRDNLVFHTPYIDGESYKKTITNYKRYVAMKNQEIELTNEPIKRYNATLLKFRKLKPLTLDEIQSGKEFKAGIVGLETESYNKEVEKFNNGRPILLKKLHTTIKYQSELIFVVVLNFTAKQIQTRNHIRRNMPSVTQMGTLPKTNLNSYEMLNHNLETCPNLYCSQETIKRHLKIFRENKILVGYEGRNERGTKKPARAWINPAILDIKDQKTQKTENQSFKSVEATECSYIHPITRTNKKEVNKKEHLQANESGSKSDENKNENTGSKPLPANEKREQLSGPAREIYLFSEKMRQKILDPVVLCRELADKKHKDRPFLDIDIFRHEAKKGIISKEEFQELVKQEFLKNLSTLYKKDEQTPNFSTWMKAYWEFSKHKLQNFAGITYTKDRQVDELIKFRWMIHRAKLYFNRVNFNPLYPGQYLDFERKDAREIGFWYLEKKYKTYQERKKNTAKKQIAKNEGEKRRDKIKKSRQLEKKISLFVRGKINEENLIDYVTTNHSHNDLILLPYLIEKQK